MCDRKARGKREQSEVRRPWIETQLLKSTESATSVRNDKKLFRSFGLLLPFPGGDALSFASRLPLAFIYRTVGALFETLEAKPRDAPYSLSIAMRANVVRMRVDANIVPRIVPAIFE